MAQDKEAFLSRWSRLKQEKPKPAEVEKKQEVPPAELPPVESLTPQSDAFKSFMHPKVKDALRRVALKKLFSDPHFNIPDPFEPYSRDFNIAEPIPPEMLATLNQAKTVLFREEEEEKEKQRLAEEEAKAEQQVTLQKPEPDEPGRKDA